MSTKEQAAVEYLEKTGYVYTGAGWVLSIFNPQIKTLDTVTAEQPEQRGNYTVLLVRVKDNKVIRRLAYNYLLEAMYFRTLFEESGNYRVLILDQESNIPLEITPEVYARSLSYESVIRKGTPIADEEGVRLYAQGIEEGIMRAAHTVETFAVNQSEPVPELFEALDQIIEFSPYSSTLVKTISSYQKRIEDLERQLAEKE